jgi:pimeloyl-ACP methyl ester carboxylesterase
MKSFLAFIKDLFQTLPAEPHGEWTSLSDLSPLKPTVILVSGFGATSRNLSVIRKRFLKDGFNVLILPLDWNVLGDNVRGFYRMAEKLSSLILSLRKTKGMSRNKVYLVAHSAGGLVARYYVQFLGGSHYCEGLVTLATPHSGTWIAALGFLTHLILKARCLYQMLPISRFVKDLNEGHWPVDFPMASIFSNADFLCPKKSTVIPELILSAESRFWNIELHGLSHGDFLMSKRCYSSLMESFESIFSVSKLVRTRKSAGRTDSSQ